MKTRGHCTRGFTCAIWDKYYELSLRRDTAGHKTLSVLNTLIWSISTPRSLWKKVKTQFNFTDKENKIYWKKHPKYQCVAQPFDKNGRADVTKHSGALVTWPRSGDTWAHDKCATAVTEQTTSASFCIHQRIKNHPRINLSFTGSGERARHFPLCVPVIGLLADRYHPSLLCAALGHVSKRRASFFPFCKETISLMAFKTGSTTIKVKTENARCRHLFPFAAQRRASRARIYTHTCIHKQTHAVTLTHWPSDILV